MGIMLYRSLLSCYSRGAFLWGEVDDWECPQSPFSFAKMFYVLKWFGENETLRRRNFPNNCINNNNYKIAKSKVEKPTSIKEEILVYPNPTNGLINIQLPKKGNWIISITDITGKILWNKECRGCDSIIKHEMNNIKGLYLINIIDKVTGQQSVKKINLQ